MTLGTFNLKPKFCEYDKCRTSFTPVRPFQAVCSPICGLRKAAAARKAEKADFRKRKEAVKTTKQLIPLAQADFNAYIRERDKDKGCFVCGEPFPKVNTLGGVMDAGHVRSRGAAKHLRFNEDNCHGECKSCNSSWGAKPHQIEAGAIRRIGQERYDALVRSNEPHHWTREEVLAIRATYKAKLKELKGKA